MGMAGSSAEGRARRVALIGYGKIGRTVAQHVRELGCEVAFALDPVAEADDGTTIVRTGSPGLYEGIDLVVECATAAALVAQIDDVLERTNLMPFSLTAFSDDDVLERAKRTAQEHGHAIYLPHGAILGLDGIWDARSILTEVSIVTTKSPASLGLAACSEPKTVFEGCTRDACAAFPRNVNVHAAVALAGIGFSRTHSMIVADPNVTTNTHVISVKGEGIEFTLNISSFTTGGVTGVYTPLSACGSLDRVLKDPGGLSFV